MMLEWLNEPAALKGAAAIRQAVRQVLEQPDNRTRDLGGSITTTDMGDRVAAALAIE